MKRLPDWQLRLEAFERERAEVPFAWGSNDCALFAADAVQAITGVHLCPDLRGHRNVREGGRAIAALGGARAIACKALGHPLPPAFARVGDVVVVQAGKREALAVCNGQTAIAPGEHGMVAIPMAQALSAWRVG
jgi:hypothetical protein